LGDHRSRRAEPGPLHLAHRLGTDVQDDGTVRGIGPHHNGTVRQDRAATAQEAVELGAVDLLAADRAELFRALDGRPARIDEGTIATLRTAGAPVVEQELSLARRILQILADPDLAFLFLSLGALALLYELASPGAGLGGVIGAVMLVLAFFALSVLPVTAAGRALLLLAPALFAAELFTPRRRGLRRRRHPGPAAGGPLPVRRPGRRQPGRAPPDRGRRRTRDGPRRPARPEGPPRPAHHRRAGPDEPDDHAAVRGGPHRAGDRVGRPDPPRRTPPPRSANRPFPSDRRNRPAAGQGVSSR
jgi:hypothetical protein